MNSSRILALALLASVFFSFPVSAIDGPKAIWTDPRPSWSETLAAREVRRYYYVRTGELLPIRAVDRVPAAGPAILVARKDRDLATAVVGTAQLAGLGSEDYRLSTVGDGTNRVWLLAGGSDAGTLYAAYRFAECLGMRFYLHGDVAPDEQLTAMPVVNESAAPLFRLRGIQPFHDFPEGPDWWNRDDYLAILAQLPKLRMNFIGLHTYPEGGPNAEPTVWIGPPSEIGDGARVKASYPSSYANTLRGNWGYTPKRTGTFSCGADGLFPRDDYGPETMAGLMPQPADPAGCNLLFERTGLLLGAVFRAAHRLGIQTCVGTETPLTLPRQLRERLEKQGFNLTNRTVLEDIYAGIFRRIQQTYPVDYYWFWTPEGWTWDGSKAERVAETTNDLAAAIAAWHRVQPGFELATCGWVLGPQGDRAMFDRILPKNVAMSCINREVGKTPLEPGFSRVEGRAKWAIPWLEDDGGLTAPELWAGRMRRDALDAKRYGCEGLFGIHWRTRVLGPAVAALSQAAWNQEPWAASYQPDSEAAFHFPAVSDFYADWASHEFGPAAGPAAAAIFARMDGHLPRPVEWVDGPGGIRPDPAPWEQVAPRYGFVEEFGALDAKVRGAGNRERFEWWLHQFQSMRETAQVRCIWARFTNALVEAKSAATPGDRARIARERALPLRRELVARTESMYLLLLSTVGNPGELGTVANWEEHNFPDLLEKPGKELEEMLGEPLPADAVLPRVYRGSPRLVVPTVRGSFSRNEPAEIRAWVLSGTAPGEVTLRWRVLGGSEFKAVPMKTLGRRGYSAVMPGTAIQPGGCEYYLEARWPDGAAVRFPAGAPERTQTVVVAEPW
ncbi:MAG: hypothetical protein U1F98_01950 [Verrucomicrobiota bacterium]